MNSKFIKNFGLFTLLLSAFACFGASGSANNLVATLHQQAPYLPTSALQTAVKAYQYGLAHGEVKNPHLAVADMQLNSAQKRLWVFDMQHEKLLYRTLVAQGRTTGLLNATYFSNKVNSHATSLGVYITQQNYIGHHGLSLRLQGMDAGFNSNAYQRDIVLHAASYVSQKFVNTYHRLGRSWGCPAVSEQLIKPLVNTLKDGAMLMVYYPQKQWLNSSKFLQE
jgi:hypothetical protein